MEITQNGKYVFDIKNTQKSTISFSVESDYMANRIIFRLKKDGKFIGQYFPKGINYKTGSYYFGVEFNAEYNQIEFDVMNLSGRIYDIFVSEA